MQLSSQIKHQSEQSDTLSIFGQSPRLCFSRRSGRAIHCNSSSLSKCQRFLRGFRFYPFCKVRINNKNVFKRRSIHFQKAKSKPHLKEINKLWLKPAFIDEKSFETNSPIFLTSTMHKKRQQKMLSLIFRKLDHKNLTLSRTSMICHL